MDTSPVVLGVVLIQVQYKEPHTVRYATQALTYGSKPHAVTCGPPSQHKSGRPSFLSFICKLQILWMKVSDMAKGFRQELGLSSTVSPGKLYLRKTKYKEVISQTSPRTSDGN
jgi:hypothetical protein